MGRPLTPVSVAGVARRTTRRAVVGGAAVGAAAAGTACVRVLVMAVCLPLKRSAAAPGRLRSRWPNGALPELRQPPIVLMGDGVVSRANSGADATLRNRSGVGAVCT